jgi:hypothetical protein
MPDMILITFGMILTAYNDGDSSWNSMCASARTFLQHPYLLAIINLLTNPPDDFDAILVSCS